jgi:murein lipoprotein
MNKILKALPLILSTSFITGCASSTEIDALHAKINELESRLANANTDASTAKTTAAQAAVAASAAKVSADRAAGYAQDTNNKLDQLTKNPAGK